MSGSDVASARVRPEPIEGEMKVYRLEEFRKLPEGTLFCEAEPWVFGTLHVKGETWESDFILRDLQSIEAEDSGQWGARLDEMLETGASYPINNAYGRDGTFNDKALFLVYETEDLLELRRVIDEALISSGSRLADAHSKDPSRAAMPKEEDTRPAKENDHG